MNTSNEILQMLAKAHDGDVALEGMLKYGDGIIAMFTVADSNRIVHRVALFGIISIDTNNDTLVKKWDNIV